MNRKAWPSLSTVSAIEGCNPGSLRPLAYVLDADALNTIFETQSNGNPRTGGCRVGIYNGEYLTVTPLDRPHRVSTHGQTNGHGDW